MKLFAPEYYKRFVCIADKCTHSCCIGWEIDIDSQSEARYAALTEGYGKIINDSICRENVPHFRLSADERCPHLDEKGLCKIILHLGEDQLCDICREHPRFYNDTKKGKEVGLGLACEEAGRLILSSDDYCKIVEISSNNDAYEKYSVGFDPLPLRDDILKTLADSSLPYTEKLTRLYCKYNVSPSIISDIEWKNTVSSLEYLDISHKDMFLCYSSDITTPKVCEKENERLLAYFVYRHVSQAEDQPSFRAALGFCFFCERLFASLTKLRENVSFEDCVKLSRVISEELEYSEDNTEIIKTEFSF